MATVAETLVTSGFEEGLYPITSDVYLQMVEQGLIPRDRRVFLWGGRLYSRTDRSSCTRSPKRATTLAQANMASAPSSAPARRSVFGSRGWTY